MTQEKIRLLVCSKKGDRLFLCTSLCGTKDCEKGLVRMVEFDEYWNAIQFLKANGEGNLEDYFKKS